MTLELTPFKERTAFLGHFRLRRRGRDRFPLAEVAELVGADEASAVKEDAARLAAIALYFEYRTLMLLASPPLPTLSDADLSALGRRMSKIESLLGLGGARGRKLLLRRGREAYRKAEAEYYRLRAQFPQSVDGKPLQERRRRLRRLQERCHA